MKIAFHGAAGTVTGSCYGVVTTDIRFLVDCGMFQGESEESNRRRFPFNPAELDYVLLTHAHIDHSGLLPRLVKEGFKGTILCTGATLDLCRILLPDSGHIQEQEAEHRRQKGPRQGLPPYKPLYTEAEARECLGYFKAIRYGEEVELSDSTRFVMKDAGHILGSAFIELEVLEDGHEHRVCFSGDLGNIGQPVIRDPETPSTSFDMVLMESTYGDRDHRNLSERGPELAGIINATVAQGGNVVIPSFAVGRTQDVLYGIMRLMESGAIPRVPVFIDSPMATSATDIYQRHPECFDAETIDVLRQRTDLFHGGGIRFVRDAAESRSLNRVRGAVIIASSGMCEVGRILHHLRHNLWRSESAVVFVGYQARGTLGRRILEGDRDIRIFGEPVMVRARVASIGGFSAHADQSGLLDWLGNIRQPGTLCLVHGEPEAQEALAGRIGERFGFNAVMPQLDSTAVLHAGSVTLSGGRHAEVGARPSTGDHANTAARLMDLAARIGSGEASESELEAARRALRA